MTLEQKAWIDNASMVELLRRWRFAKAGEDSIFHGAAGMYYTKVLSERREADPGLYVAVSKEIGW